eukprot:TRINITY_DN5413_c0_g1_i7.p1 TRINITY_DN5413_c0_g1~~TRINITY_DN5413_c0_g1_i7.p1  ORF type:complete len:347 (+),score=39.11 TRINITY_DN5413_c0_g1_i7:36-1043(+)
MIIHEDLTSPAFYDRHPGVIPFLPFPPILSVRNSLTSPLTLKKIPSQKSLPSQPPILSFSTSSVSTTSVTSVELPTPGGGVEDIYRQATPDYFDHTPTVTKGGDESTKGDALAYQGAESNWMTEKPEDVYKMADGFFSTGGKSTTSSTTTVTITKGGIEAYQGADSNWLSSGGTTPGGKSDEGDAYRQASPEWLESAKSKEIDRVTVDTSAYQGADPNYFDVRKGSSAPKFSTYDESGPAPSRVEDSKLRVPTGSDDLPSLGTSLSSRRTHSVGHLGRPSSGSSRRGSSASTISHPSLSRGSTESSVSSLSRQPSEIGRAVQQECRDRSRMPSSA